MKKMSMYEVLTGAFKYAKEYKGRIILSIVLAFVEGLLSDVAWGPFLRIIGNTLPDATVPIQRKYYILILCVSGCAVVDILHSICEYFTGVKMTAYLGKVRKNITELLFDKYLNLSFSYFDKNQTGEILSTLGEDVERLAHILWTVPVYIVRMIASIIIGGIFLWSINPQIVMVTIIFVAIIGVFEYFYCKRLVDAEKLARETKSDITQFTHDKISGIRTVLSFGKDESEKKELDNLYTAFIDSRNLKFIRRFVMNTGTSTLVGITYIAILAIGGYFVIHDNMKITDLLIMYNYMYILVNPIYNLNDIMDEYSVAVVGYEKIQNVLNTELDVDRKGIYKPSSIEGHIEFNDVTFNYDESKGDVLDGFSLNINPGEYVAFVGSSGSGKSTIAGLIPRFYDISAGSITLDDVNIKDYDLSFLRRNIGIVQQETYLFNGTIYDNIIYGKPDATMDEVIEATKRADAHEFISAMPDGYNSVIGERGLKLSGGQRQRIAIARLFLSDPKVIILDEATSALDTESEREIQRAIDEIAKNRTVIAIAHRLSTIVNADKICVLSSGAEICEMGTHQELIDKRGRYYELYQKSMGNKKYN